MYPNIFYPRLITSTNFDKSKIISHGLIVYAKDTKETILVQRLHSIEYLLIFTGQYRPSLIPLLIPNLTLEEILILKKIIKDNDLFKPIFLEMGYTKDLDYAYIRFIESIAIIEKCIERYSNDNKLKWTFPKGRINLEDLDGFTCACREFVEEVEHELPEATYISPNYFVVENLTTLGCKTIESRCWLYVIENKFDLSPITHHNEVNDRKWVSIEQALLNIDKYELLKPINNMIDNL
jgi:hypothetical protein